MLTKVGSQTISYDKQGNPTSYLGHSLVWEKGRQLKKFDSHTFTYNAHGIRTSKTVNGVKHTYILEGTKILRETWEGNTLIPMYDNEDSVCGIVYNDISYYFQKNLQGDIVGIVDKNANVVARYTYDAWGVCSITSDTSGENISTVNPFRYRSYYYDSEVQLYYLQSRYYNPVIGRFVNEDEVAVITAVTKSDPYGNLYAYCCNDPVDNIDRTGYAVSPANIIGAVIGGILGAVGGYFLSRWLADKLNLTGWKRTVFIVGITAIITAGAAVIGYFLGPYVQKVGQKIINYLKGLIKTHCCFIAGTMIATDNGDKPIEQIRIGDYVLSENELTGEISYKKVVDLFERKTRVLVHVVVGTEEMVTTPEHPFWVEEKGWVAAKDLCKGDKVSVRNNATNTITETLIQKCIEGISVYNFEVDEWHTYFVSTLHVLVHNKCNWNFASDSYLKKKGLDAHAIKYEYLGKNEKVSLYDLYYDKSTGAISIFLKKTKQLVEVTTYFIK